MKLRYTTTAARELEEVLAGIAERSPQGARNVQLRIRSAIEILAAYPSGGQLTTHPTLRRIVAVPYPYLIFYEARESEVVIIGIRHAARDPATMPGDA